MRARVGDLAIVRFDLDNPVKNKYDEKVGIVIQTDIYQHVRDYKFIYWEKIGNRVEVLTGFLPSSRLVRARPKRDDWKGTLHSLTRDNVVPVT